MIAPELLIDGALTVSMAEEFSGLSRARLYELMADGSLAWFKSGEVRLIPRRSLVDHLAALAAKEPQLRKTPRPASRIH